MDVIAALALVDLLTREPTLPVARRQKRQEMPCAFVAEQGNGYQQLLHPIDRSRALLLFVS